METSLFKLVSEELISYFIYSYLSLICVKLFYSVYYYFTFSFPTPGSNFLKCNIGR